MLNQTRERIMRALALLSLFLMVSFVNFGQAQNEPVQWQITSEPRYNGDIVIKFSANIGKGWHLYSQYLPDGGPIPTRISFDQISQDALIGKPEEEGSATKFYDDIYEMEITWYSETVTFFQYIKPTNQITMIKGSIEFMVCNDHICIPDKQNFSVVVR